MVKKAAQATPNLLLRSAREERGWTQTDVADRIGAPHPLNISRWESGTAFPRSHYIEQLCLLFDKTPRELGLLPPASARAGGAFSGNTAQALEEPSTGAPFLLPEGTITLLFATIEGSTRLLQHLGDRSTLVLEEWRHLLRVACQQWNGHEVDTPGEAFFVAFARATDAVEAAVDAQRLLFTHAWPEGMRVGVRMGLHTGEPELSSQRYVGLDLQRGAQIMSAGHGGQVLLSQTTRDLVEHDLPDGVSLRDVGEHRLKDIGHSEQLFQLVIAGLPADFPPLPTLDTSHPPLPVLLTPLLGREQEVAVVCAELAHPTVRLLTLLGAGGIGKTRLGLQVATQMRDQFADGVCFVPLAPIRDPALVISAIAQALDIRESGARPLLEQLKEALRPRQQLLLLDNVEQVLTVAPHLEELLAACPHLKLLVTSRATLHVQAEQVFPVPPLPLPDLLHLPQSEALTQYAAVALFLHHARALQPSFQLTQANARAVAEICVRLDGLPLAIELAAARIRLLPPQALLGRLSQPLTVLTSGPRNLPVRQQTLRNTLTWSYDLLEHEEQQVFRQLSVFVGDWTLEAAEVVVNTHRPPDRSSVSVLDAVASLLDTSLLVQVGKPGEEARLHMLETVREYGLECLEGSGEETAVHERHAHYFLTVAEEAEIHLTRPEQEVWQERLSREEANLRAALTWCKTTPDAVEIGLRLAGALCYYWFLQSTLHEGSTWLEAMLARTGNTDRSDARGRALFGAGLMAWAVGDVEAATRCLEESQSICREAGDQRYTSYAEMILGNVLSRQGNNVQARHLSEESHSRLKGLGDDAWDEAFTLYDRGINAYHSGDPAAARAHFEESLRLFRKIREARYASLVLSFLLVIVASQGDKEMVRSLSQQSLPLMQQARKPGALGLFLINNGEMWLHSYGDEPLAKVLYRLGLSLWQDMQQGGQGIGIVKALAGLAEVAAAQGKAERAGRLFGAAAHLLPSDSLELQDVNGRVAAARVKLDAATFEAGLCAGQAMTQEQAMTDALQDGQ